MIVHHMLKIVLASTKQELQPVLMEMGEPKGHVRQASLATLLARMAAAPWTAMPHQVWNHPLCGPFNALHIVHPWHRRLGADVQGADMTQAQGDAYAAASRRANSLLEYAWLYVFGKASSPAPLRCAANRCDCSCHTGPVRAHHACESSSTF